MTNGEQTSNALLLPLQRETFRTNAFFAKSRGKFSGRLPSSATHRSSYLLNRRQHMTVSFELLVSAWAHPHTCSNYRLACELPRCSNTSEFGHNSCEKGILLHHFELVLDVTMDGYRDQIGFSNAKFEHWIIVGNNDMDTLKESVLVVQRLRCLDRCTRSWFPVTTSLFRGSPPSSVGDPGNTWVSSPHRECPKKLFIFYRDALYYNAAPSSCQSFFSKENKKERQKNAWKTRRMRDVNEDE